MGGSRRGTEIEGYQPAPGEDLEIDSDVVGPRYFTNMKIRILAGRDFEDRDREGAACVAVVNEAFARRYFSGASPLGKHLAKFESFRKPARTECAIVGVVRDTAWQSLKKEIGPHFWLAMQQTMRQRIILLVTTDADPAALARLASAILHTLALRSRAGDSPASLRATAEAGIRLICGRPPEKRTRRQS